MGEFAKKPAKLTLEDKIVLARFATGLIFGVAVFIASFFADPLNLSSIVWPLSVVVYYVTIAYVAIKLRPISRFQLYLRGLGTFYATWLLTAIILNELTKLAGLRS